MTPDRRKAYISNAHTATDAKSQTTASISVLDAVALTNIATIPVPPVPGESQITPDGRRLFVIHQQGLGHHQGCPVDVIDTATDMVINTVTIPGSWAKDILITPDSQFVYIANYSNGEVDVINTDTYQVTTIPTAGGSRRLAMSPAGDRVYVANYTGNSVSVIDTATLQLIKTIPAGNRTRGIAVAAHGNGEIYATNVQDGTVSVIDPNTLAVIATIPTGSNPWEVIMTADGAKAFVSNAYSDDVSVIDTATHTVIATLPTGRGPFIMFVSPDQTKAYVSNSRDTSVTVIDIPSLTVSNTIARVELSPFDLAFGR